MIEDIICKHKWKINSYSGKQFQYVNQYCVKCSEHRIIKATGKLALKQKEMWRKFVHPKPEEDVHHVWHKFVRYFAKPHKDYSFVAKNGKMHKTKKKKNYYDIRDGRGTFKWTGYDLMMKIERWAENYPKDVFVSRCDDCMHMGSRQYYIVHASKKEYMGITVIYVPQSGEDPSVHFLYPDHMRSVTNVFNSILKMHGNKKIDTITKFKDEWLNYC